MAVRALLPKEGGSWIAQKQGGIQNFDNVFEVWHHMEGWMNPDDGGGYRAFIGINEKYNPGFFSENEQLLIDWRKNAAILIPKAKEWLKRNYWDRIKADTPQDKLIIFFYKQAWLCKYTRRNHNLRIAIESLYAPTEFSLACAASSKVIGYEGVYRRVFIYNYAFGAQIPL